MEANSFDRIELKNPDNPNLGYKLKEPIVIHDPAVKLGEMSLTDGVFIPKEAPPEIDCPHWEEE